MKKAFTLILIVTMLFSLVVVCFAQEGKTDSEYKRVRTIVTADWLDDDQCSLVRFLLYANDFEVEGIIADKTAEGEGISGQA